MLKSLRGQHSFSGLTQHSLLELHVHLSKHCFCYVIKLLVPTCLISDIDSRVLSMKGFTAFSGSYIPFGGWEEVIVTHW